MFVYVGRGLVAAVGIVDAVSILQKDIKKDESWISMVRYMDILYCQPPSLCILGAYFHNGLFRVYIQEIDVYHLLGSLVLCRELTIKHVSHWYPVYLESCEKR